MNGSRQPRNARHLAGARELRVPPADFRKRVTLPARPGMLMYGSIQGEPAVPMTLAEAREKALQMGLANPVYRGEPYKYDNTFSSHHRLFQGPRFTQQQKEATAERMVWIAQTLNIVLHDVPVFASHEVAGRNIREQTQGEIHDVIYCFLQHYHVATPFIDVTTNLDVACSFCVTERTYETSQFARLYVIDANRLVCCGLTLSRGQDSRARRPKLQDAMSLYLSHGSDFQKAAKPFAVAIDVEVSEEERRAFYRPELYDAREDEVAGHVAALLYRCAWGDLASPDLRVSEYFADVFDILRRAGAIPRL